MEDCGTEVVALCYNPKHGTFRQIGTDRGLDFVDKRAHLSAQFIASVSGL